MKNPWSIARPSCRAALVVFVPLIAALLALFLDPVEITFAADVSITVDTTVDNNSLTGCTAAPGDCSLRGAITKANADAGTIYTINIPPGTYVLATIGADEDLNATGDLDITRAMTLTGAGPELTIIDANGIDRALHVHGGVSATISNLRITGGQTTFGGGIWNDGGQTTLSNVQVVSNMAENRGGGIYNFSYDPGASPIITVTAAGLIQHNAAGYNGGGIYSEGQVTLSDVLVISNTAGRGGGIYTYGGQATLSDVQVVFNTAGSGGGISNENGQATLTNVQVASNTAGNGGGIYNENGQATLTDVQVVSNTAIYDGGGIYTYGGQATLSNVQVASNTAGRGGGIANLGEVTLSDVQVVTNTAGGDGGGIYIGSSGAEATLSNVLIVSNTAGDNGGGIYNAFGQVSLSAVQVLSNTAGDRGGGIDNAYRDYGSVTIVGSCVVRNSDTAVENMIGLGSNVMATSNWWGAASGPSGVAPGNGDSVSSDVDFAGFLSAPILGCPTLQTDLAIAKYVEPPVATPGQAITYTLTYTNVGPDAAHNAVIADSVPLSVTGLNYTSTGATVIPSLGTTYVFTVPSLAPGAGGNITITGMLDDSLAVAGTVFTNTATITATTDATPNNNLGSASLRVRPYLSIGGTVSGLAGSGLVLQNNGGDNLAISANGVFTFATALLDGSAYNVTVKTQPAGPSQTCTVTNGAGALAGANIMNVIVTCNTGKFTVGGTVSGLTGSGLVLQNNGSDDLAIGANGVFTFATVLVDGSPYNVTVRTQPARPPQTCMVTSGAGTLVGSNVTDVAVGCTGSAEPKLYLPVIQR